MIFRFKENRVRRAYLGGKRIDEFSGKTECVDSNKPEDWLASAVEAFNPDYESIENEGISILDDGRLFKNILEEDPESILGERLNRLHSGKTSTLVKLLDSAERLVIQCHPTVDFAKKHFNSNFGKTECWYFLSTEEDAYVYFGFKPGITREKWVSLFENQNIEGMLDCLHKIPVKPGELWFVDGGIPHAIGGGCFMIELQEPSDLMVIPEKYTPSGRKLSEQKLHGGLGFERMFDCFIYEGYTIEELKARYFRKYEPKDNKLVHIVDETLTDKFAMQGLRVCGTSKINLGDTYAVCVVTDGRCTVTDNCEEISLEKGNSFLIAANSGEIEINGCAEIVLCMA